MFEYWFLNIESPRTGTTHDFLEVCCQITEAFDSKVAGQFVTAMLEGQKKALPFLRVIDWKFEFELANGEIIKLHKLI